jgi:hypothetical protein
MTPSTPKLLTVRERHWEGIDFPSFFEKITATGIGSKASSTLPRKFPEDGSAVGNADGCYRSCPVRAHRWKRSELSKGDRMIEHPDVAAMVAAIAGAVAWTTRARLPRTMLWSGAAILVSA